MEVGWGYGRESRLEESIRFGSELLGPDSDEFGALAKADRDAPRVNKEIKFATAEGRHPVKPLHTGGQAGSIYCAGGQTGGGKSEATAA